MNSEERSPSTKRKFITHEEFVHQVVELSRKIKRSGKKFDWIYPIPRGGLSAALYLSHLLNIPIRYEWITGRCEILIVDDVADTGRTIREHAKTKAIYVGIGFKD